MMNFYDLTMQKIILLSCIFLISCTSYIANNKYAAKQIKRTRSLSMKFDLLLDEDVSIDDPRVKSIMYASNKNTQVIITYANPNAQVLANKLAMILTKQNLYVVKPQLINIENNRELNKYIIVYIKY